MKTERAGRCTMRLVYVGSPHIGHWGTVQDRSGRIVPGWNGLAVSTFVPCQQSCPKAVPQSLHTAGEWLTRLS